MEKNKIVLMVPDSLYCFLRRKALSYGGMSVNQYCLYLIAKVEGFEGNMPEEYFDEGMEKIKEVIFKGVKAATDNNLKATMPTITNRKPRLRRISGEVLNEAMEALIAEGRISRIIDGSVLQAHSYKILDRS